MNDGFRVLMVLRTASDGVAFPAVRLSLDQLSWDVIDCFRQARISAVPTSFPRWIDVNEMGDFALVRPHFPVNGDGCLCIHIQPSPIRMSFDDVHALASISPDARRMIASADASERSRALSDPRWSACVQELRTTALAQSLRKVASAPSVAAGFLCISSGTPLEDVLDGSIDSAILGFWLNTLGARPREMGFRFGTPPTRQAQ